MPYGHIVSVISPSSCYAHLKFVSCTFHPRTLVNFMRFDIITQTKSYLSSTNLACNIKKDWYFFLFVEGLNGHLYVDLNVSNRNLIFWWHIFFHSEIQHKIFFYYAKCLMSLCYKFRRLFLRSIWVKNIITTGVLFSIVLELWAFEE
jgi:hypothetical protein